jgi:hypothetical protein
LTGVDVALPGHPLFAFALGTREFSSDSFDSVEMFASSQRPTAFVNRFRPRRKID